MNEICTLSVTCVAGRHLSQAYRFVLALPAESTLDELASYILEVVDFDGDHLSSFYLANGPCGKRTWFPTSGEWDEDADVPDTRLCDISLSAGTRNCTTTTTQARHGVSKSSGRAGKRTPWPVTPIPAWSWKKV